MYEVESPAGPKEGGWRRVTPWKNAAVVGREPERPCPCPCCCQGPQRLEPELTSLEYHVAVDVVRCYADLNRDRKATSGLTVTVAVAEWDRCLHPCTVYRWRWALPWWSCGGRWASAVSRCTSW